jgi:hypothetical protein
MKLALLALLLVPVALSAQAINYTEHIDSPMVGVIESPCSESVAVSGTVHSVIHLTQQNNQVSIDVHVGPRGDMTATGLDTGTQYNMTGQTFTRLQFGQNNLENYSYHDQFKVVGLFTVHYTYHLLFGDNYFTPKAFVDHFSVTCD